MRVLHFFKTYWPDTFGGVERVIHALAKGSKAHDIDTHILALSPSPSDKTLCFDNHVIHQARCDLELASTGFSLDAFGKFRQQAKEADVIHYHFPWPFMDLVEQLTPHGKPTLVTYHSDIVKQKIFLQLYKPLMHSFLRRVDHIAATSANYLATSPVLQTYKDKTSVIPLGLAEADYPAPNAEKMAYWQQKFPDGFFFFCGVLRYYKGIHILFEAARKTGLPVVVLGGGRLENQLKQQANDHGLESFHLLGALPDDDKIALLNLSKALVFPSHLRSEAFGLSLVEAALYGKPMISCDIGTGTSYVNQHKETGLVIPPNDSNALADAMMHLWHEEEKRKLFAKQARQRYLDLFTADRMVENYVQLYNKLLRA